MRGRRALRPTPAAAHLPTRAHARPHPHPRLAPRNPPQDSDAPRAVLRWDGQHWKLVAIVETLAAAQSLMRPDKPGPELW
ncbi:DUF6087 family protein [Streptomyces sp. NPDC042319]|uniref:DUF6087 family protein n=1 Tax=Streptomyces sp. NPDC042319 TaxID=3154332 RepID=UPI0033C58667